MFYISAPSFIIIGYTIAVLLIFKVENCCDSGLEKLAVVCGVQEKDILSAAPKECTALGLATSNIDQLNTVNNIRGSLPLLIIMDTIEFASMEESTEDNFDDLFSDIKNVTFDYLVFDHAYYYVPTNSIPIQKHCQNIGKFLEQVKTYFPGTVIGLVLNQDVESMKDSIDFTIINQYSDLYLLASLDYRKCKHHDHQADMAVLATKDDILGSLDALKNAAIPLNKTIYIINLVIQSIKDSKVEPMGYSYLCEKKLSVHRKYCFNTIQNLFEKARLRISEGTAGIFINGIGVDDVNGTCGCKSSNDGDPAFRGLKTIAGASQENNNNESFYDCVTGRFPIILN